MLYSIYYTVCIIVVKLRVQLYKYTGRFDKLLAAQINVTRSSYYYLSARSNDLLDWWLDCYLFLISAAALITDWGSLVSRSKISTLAVLHCDNSICLVALALLIFLQPKQIVILSWCFIISCRASSWPIPLMWHIPSIHRCISIPLSYHIKKTNVIQQVC